MIRRTLARDALALLFGIAGCGDAGCGKASYQHRLTLTSMTSQAAAYKQAVGTITTTVEVNDPAAPPQRIERTFDHASLERGVKNEILYEDAACHARDELGWSLVSVHGSMRTPSGTPQPRPDWGLEDTTSPDRDRQTVKAKPPSSRGSHGGQRRTRTFLIDMQRNDVQIVVQATSTKCGADGKPLVSDGERPEPVEDPEVLVEPPR